MAHPLAAIKVFATLALSIFLIAIAGAQTMNTVSDLQWKNRIILVQAQGDGGDALKTLGDSRDAIADRDIIWFVVTDGGMESNLPDVSPAMAESVQETLSGQPQTARVILIGKDGGIKDRSDRLDLEGLFAQIDRMPMRIQEMRRNENGER